MINCALVSRIVTRSLLVVLVSLGSAQAQEGSSAVDRLNAYAAAMSGNGDQLSGMGDYLSGQGNNLIGQGELIRARGEYIRALAEAQLTLANARLVDAQTAHKWQEVRKLTLMVNRLQKELKDLRRQEYLNNRKIKQIERYSRTINLVVRGYTSKTVFRYFDLMIMRHVSISAVTTAMSVELPEIAADNFIPNDPTEESIAFAGGNVGQMWNFMRTHNFAFAPWGNAHITMLLSLEVINESSAKQITKYREYIAQIRSGFFDVWNPPVDGESESADDF